MVLFYYVAFFTFGSPGFGHVMADAMYVLLLCLMCWERKSSTATQIRVHNFVLFV